VAISGIAVVAAAVPPAGATPVEEGIVVVAGNDERTPEFVGVAVMVSEAGMVGGGDDSAPESISGSESFDRAGSLDSPGPFMGAFSVAVVGRTSVNVVEGGGIVAVGGTSVEVVEGGMPGVSVPLPGVTGMDNVLFVSGSGDGAGSSITAGVEKVLLLESVDWIPGRAEVTGETLIGTAHVRSGLYAHLTSVPTATP
jgi:hypothetical protein